ncbi:HAMP domain-containing sensor histidine kinase [Thermosynechococcus sp. PKX82]|uniref:sensor histidine kinase n=1 Tax=Thermosynechococcus sp. PKX82 TaxID=3074086 RepID=UPI00287379DD|nr:HAMP domain-containing sensor histidine kinase [Thermosynechococcus sp. PKX82]WNC28740.1 HAMP domain-containing sensor histidine kinase [Thermosynechococcus sp. PKX82]
MVLAIGLIPTLNRQVSNLRHRLFFIYFLVITGILSISSFSIYSLIVYHRYNQLDDHLKEVGTQSANILEILQHEYEELKKEPKYKGYVPKNVSGDLQPITVSQLMGKYYFESVYEVMTNFPSHFSQSVQWYDKDKKLIVYEGRRMDKVSIPNHLSDAGTIVKEDQYRYFFLPVYARANKMEPHRQAIGYVCVIESTAELDRELEYLKSIFLLNILGISMITLLAAFWLTNQSLQPILILLNQLKQFTADASHQLRHPLTAIQSSISLLEQYSKNLEPSQSNKFKVILSACYQMNTLINQLLLLARMDHHKLDQSQWVNVDLDELLESLVELQYDRAKKKQIHLTYHCDTNAYVYGNPEQIYEIFSNLLDNALHYTPSHGAVTINLKKRGAFAIVEVQDTGIGIPPEDICQVFNRFWRSQEAQLYHAQGSGLGLAVVKALVEHYGGTVDVQSQRHQGTTFTVKLLARS